MIGMIGGARGIIEERGTVIGTTIALADIGIIEIVKTGMTGESRDRIDPLRIAITLTDGEPMIGEKAMGTEILETETVSVIAETETDPVATTKIRETIVRETETHTPATSPAPKKRSRSASSKRKNDSAS